MKMCEQILRKRQRPNTIQIFWIARNQEKTINSLSYRSRLLINISFKITLPASGSFQQFFVQIQSNKRVVYPQYNLNSNCCDPVKIDQFFLFIGFILL